MDKNETAVIKYLMQENIMMRTQIGALKGLVTVNFLGLQKLGVNATKESVEKIYRDLLQKSHEEILVTHPFFEESWRTQLQNALGDIEGLFLPDID